jgi:hypothetical protein
MFASEAAPEPTSGYFCEKKNSGSRFRSLLKIAGRLTTSTSGSDDRRLASLTAQPPPCGPSFLLFDRIPDSAIAARAAALGKNSQQLSAEKFSVCP